MDKSSRSIRKRYSKIITFCLLTYDIIAICSSYFLALWLRFDGSISKLPDEYLKPYLRFLPFYVVISLVVFILCKMYRSIWKYISLSEAMRTVVGSIITSVIHIVLITVFFKRMPLSYYIFGSGIQLFLLLAARFSYRFVLFIIAHLENKDDEGFDSRVMIIGCGSAGRMIIKDLKSSDVLNEKICCIIDDDPILWKKYIEGIPVAGGRNTIIKNVEKYKIDKIYIAIPSASKETLNDIFEICSNTNCKIKSLPRAFQYVDDNISVKEMKDISVEDLLGREPISTDYSEISSFISGKVVLVTGGGGSIGSELCRQIAQYNPEKLIIFDIYENNAYDIQLELKAKYPSLNLVTLIGSVRDSRRLIQIFSEYHPDVVYHAAAHKHVPLMEDSPNEAIKNNVIGTYKTAYTAMMFGVKRFVLISTDKAVNPTNIMGASKRLCEMVVQAFNEKIVLKKTNEIPLLFTHEKTESDLNFTLPDDIKTEFVAVRFGNVLGSNGSVIPLFKKQIEAGGPVTVTHPEIIRYFMTIPEAVGLVLTAGTFAKGGEIFVLDMGSPVRIDTLARNLIKLSGYKPDIDIKIEYTGLRPGEKLFEEKLMAEEGLKKTKNDLIHIGCPIPFDTDEFFDKIQSILISSYNNSNDIKHTIADLVKTYKPEN